MKRTGVRISPRGVASAVLTLLFGIALVLVLIGVATGSIGMFLNPRIVPRTIIALGVLVVVAGVHSVWGIRGRRDPGLRRLLPFVVTLALVPAAARHASADYSDIRLFVPGGPSSRGAVTDPVRAGDVTATTSSTGESGWVGPANAELLAEVAAVSEPDSAVDFPENSARLPAEGPIVLENDTFDRVVQALWDDPTSYRGRTVRLTGFVYRRAEWNSPRFVAARMLIWCCVADAMVTGLLVDPSDHDDIPRDRQWIEIEGTLSVTDRFSAGSIEMVSVPTLTDIAWHPVSPPAQEYIFSDISTTVLTTDSQVDSP